MSIKIIKKILILSLFYFTFEALGAEENLKSIGKFKDWESFILSQDENKTCFAQSIPVVRAPKKLKRGPSRLFVSFRPNFFAILKYFSITIDALGLLYLV